MPLPPLTSLYLHIPFCAKRCDYCAFYTLAGTSAEQRAAYLTRLEAEMVERAPHCGALDHVYLGGGTPTALSIAELTQLLGAVRRHFTLAADCEFSTEANPGSLTAEKLDLFLAHGVNRFSLGVQSFDVASRAAIGRIGLVGQVPRAYALLAERGVTNFSGDLIYGMPGQTLAGFEDDLQHMLSYNPAHLSAYSLIVEEGTPLAQRGGREADDGLLATYWLRAGELLAAAGRPRYEVSNYARPGAACRHNVHVWYGGTFAGLGPSACWYDGHTRWTNVPSLADWLAGAPPIADYLPPEQRAAEILATGLRTVAGWQRAGFLRATGFDFLALRGKELEALAEDGVVQLAGDHLFVPPDKLIFADYVERELL